MGGGRGRPVRNRQNKVEAVTEASSDDEGLLTAARAKALSVSLQQPEASNRSF